MAPEDEVLQRDEHAREEREHEHGGRRGGPRDDKQEERERERGEEHAECRQAAREAEEKVGAVNVPRKTLELDGVRTAIKYEEPGNDDNAEAGGDCTDGYDVLRDAIDGQDGSRRKTKNGRVNPCDCEKRRANNVPLGQEPPEDLVKVSLQLGMPQLAIWGKTVYDRLCERK